MDVTWISASFVIFEQIKAYIMYNIYMSGHPQWWQWIVMHNWLKAGKSSSSGSFVYIPDLSRGIFNPLSANTTKFCQQIVWVCLNILWVGA